MKTFSKVVLALALTGSAGALTIVPANAKDKKEEAKPGLKLSPDILKAAQGAQTALAAKDIAAATPLVAQVEAGAKTPDDKYLAANFRLNLEQLKLQAATAANPSAPQDNTPLIAPLDALIASPNVPPEARGQILYQRGAIAYNARQYAQATQFFAQAKAAGYANDNLDMLIVKSKMDGGDTAGGVAELNGVIDKATAAGQKAPEEYYRYALSKDLAAKDNAGSFALMKKYLTAYPTSKNWRDMIVIYGLQNGSMATLDNSQKLDLFRLMRATKSLADQVDYGDYAQKAFDRGLPAETLTVLSEGAAFGQVSGRKQCRGDVADECGSAAEGRRIDEFARDEGRGLAQRQARAADRGCVSRRRTTMRRRRRSTGPRCRRAASMSMRSTRASVSRSLAQAIRPARKRRLRRSRGRRWASPNCGRSMWSRRSSPDARLTIVIGGASDGAPFHSGGTGRPRSTSPCGSSATS